VLLGNSLDYAALIFAIARLRLVWVAVNIKQNEAGMRHMLESCEPKLIISDRRFELIITDCKTNQCPLIWYRPDEDETLTGIFENLPQTGSDDLPSPGKTGERFCIKFTSGTTGPPKGAVLAQKSVIAAGWASLLVSKVKAGDRMLLWEPLYHLSGCQMLILPLLQQIELVMTARFSASTFSQTAREYGITHLHYLGGVAQILLKQPEKSKQDREHPVSTAWGAGWSAQVWQAFVQRFGVERVECYGLTESAGVATAGFTGKPGSIGKVLRCMDVAVFD
jgi:crotonobetaine/carnitine-CoA ligase